jgi:hypothetical protein
MGELWFVQQQARATIDPWANVENGSAVRLDSQWNHEFIFWRIDGRYFGFDNDKATGMVRVRRVEEICGESAWEVFDRPRSDEHREEIWQRAWSVLGTVYDVHRWNCQSYVHFSYYGVPHSESVRVGTIWAGDRSGGRRDRFWSSP